MQDYTFLDCLRVEESIMSLTSTDRGSPLFPFAPSARHRARLGVARRALATRPGLQDGPVREADPPEAMPPLGLRGGCGRWESWWWMALDPYSSRQCSRRRATRGSPARPRGTGGAGWRAPPRTGFSVVLQSLS